MSKSIAMNCLDESNACFGLSVLNSSLPYLHGQHRQEEKMSYLDRDPNGMYRNRNEQGPGPRLMGADTLMGEDVYNSQDEDLGDIK